MTKDEAEDVKRHFDVVAEHLDSRMQAVAEGVAVNAERVEGLRGETRAGFRRLEGEMRQGFGQLGQRVERLESKQTL